MFRAGDFAALAAVAVCLALAAVAVWAFRRNRPVFFFVTLFFIALAPTSNVFLLIGTIMAERFLYLPAVAFAACVAMALRAAYFVMGHGRDRGQFTPECSRRARAIEVWAALRSLGRRGLADLIDRTCRYAKQFAEGLERAGYSILNEVVLNQILVSFGDTARTRRVVKALEEDGTCWCGGTEWRGQTAMRISVSSWATTEEDVERSLDAMIRIARRTDRNRNDGS
jgi:hypothetical protein